MMTSQPIVWTTICTSVCAYFCVRRACAWLSAHIKSDKLRSMAEILKRHASDIQQDLIVLNIPVDKLQYII